jgi:hypothetical protein
MPTPTYLINSSFFVAELNIPNSDDTRVLEKINHFIAKYEPECLLKCFGYSLFKAFGNESSQRMTDLLEGCEYVDAVGDTQFWKGLVFEDNRSLIANYIYYHFMESSVTQTTGTSVSLNKPEAGVNYAPVDKMVSAWNVFSEDVSEMLSFLWNKKDGNGDRVYPEMTPHQFLKTSGYTRKINALGI